MAVDEGWRERVRERAYALWLREGSPDGRAEQFWLMAEEELLAEGQGRPSAPPRGRPARSVDEFVGDSLPADDAPAPSSGAGAPAGKARRRR